MICLNCAVEKWQRALPPWALEGFVASVKWPLFQIGQIRNDPRTLMDEAEFQATLLHRVHRMLAMNARAKFSVPIAIMCAHPFS